MPSLLDYAQSIVLLMSQGYAMAAHGKKQAARDSFLAVIADCDRCSQDYPNLHTKDKAWLGQKVSEAIRCIEKL